MMGIIAQPVQATTGETPRPLALYLQDHYAAVTATVAAFRRVAAVHHSPSVRAMVCELEREVAADRGELLALMHQLGVEPCRAGGAASGVVERLGHARPGTPAADLADLSDVVDLESLVVAMETTVRGWLALLSAAETDRRLNPYHLEVLVRRGREQQDRLERARREAARVVLGQRTADV